MNKPKTGSYLLDITEPINSFSKYLGQHCKIKHNLLIRYIYDLYLNIQCRKVESYIFVANAGRSGSLSLQNVFSAVDGCISLHEPNPKMLNEYINEKDKEIYFKQQFHCLKKIYIKRAAINKRYYFESNHMFIKNFAKYTIDEFKDKCKVIILRRDPINIATSLYQLDTIPGINNIGRLYLLDPYEGGNLVVYNNKLDLYDVEKRDFLRCLWYCYEIEARINRFKADYPEVCMFEINTHDLNKMDSVIALLECLNVEYDMVKIKSIVGTRVNKRINEKRRPITFNVEELNDSFMSLTFSSSVDNGRGIE